MLRMCSENVSLGCTVFGSAKTDLGKPRNASFGKKWYKSGTGQEGVKAHEYCLPIVVWPAMGFAY